MTEKEIIINHWIEEIQKEIKENNYDEYFDKCDIKNMYEKLQISEEQLLTVLYIMVKDMRKENQELQRKNISLLNELKYSEKTVDSLLKTNKERVQQEKASWTYRQAMISAGLPIAKRKAGEGSLFDVFVAIENGWNDAEIMKEYKLSRSTLWRRKKEIENCKKENRLPM